MGVQLTKDAVDIGIVVTSGEKALAFYRDTLGLEHVEDLDLGGGTVMHRLACGSAFVKLVVPEKAPPTAPGGLQAQAGYRYCTISVANLDEVAKTCEERGYKLVVPVTEFRPGVRIAIVEDPDGNWVEFLDRRD